MSRWDGTSGYYASLAAHGRSRTVVAPVFTNIVLNAVQAMPNGGRLTFRSQRVVESTGEENMTVQRIAVSIEDTGAGIDPIHLKKIFEPLFTTKARGTGLGLAISNNIVEKHGGAILVSSQPGKGTTFTIKLPLTPPGETEGEEKPPSKTRILLVDDNKRAARNAREHPQEFRISRHQRRLRQRWRFAAAGKEEFAAALLDIKMPDLTGIDVPENQQGPKPGHDGHHDNRLRGRPNTPSSAPRRRGDRVTLRLSPPTSRRDKGPLETSAGTSAPSRGKPSDVTTALARVGRGTRGKNSRTDSPPARRSQKITLAFCQELKKNFTYHDRGCCPSRHRSRDPAYLRVRSFRVTEHAIEIGR